MAEFFVDLSATSNGNGSEASPFNSLAPINTGGWVRGDVVRLKRGSRRVVDVGNRANIVCTSGSGRLLITAYGDPSLPLPVLDGGGSTNNPLWMQSGSGVDIEHIHVTGAPGDGFSICPTTGNNLEDIEVRNCLVTRTGLNGGKGVDGIKVGAAYVDGGTVTNVRLLNNVARDCGGHGMKIRGETFNTRAVGNVALRCGTLSPAHGMGTAGMFVEALGGWTNVSGQVWERATTVPLFTDFTGWKRVYVLGAQPLYRLPLSATPATPGVGECGYGAANTLRINVGAIDPNTLTQVFAIFTQPDTSWWVGNVAAQTTDFDGVEGQGVYFDNGSIRCWGINNVALNNDGQGFFLNDATDSGHYGSFAAGNRKGGASATRGLRTNYHGNTLICDGLPGLAYQVGNQAAVARMNRIVGASVGVSVSDAGTNSVSEDENQFINCATRLSAVSAPGSRSSDFSGQARFQLPQTAIDHLRWVEALL